MKFRITWTCLLLVLAASCSKDKSPPTSPGPATEPFDSGALNTTAPTNIFVHTFNTPGTYAYHCSIHSGMNGSVTVSPTGQDSPIVHVSSNMFSPASITVKTTSYVKWHNAAGVHTVTRP